MSATMPAILAQFPWYGLRTKSRFEKVALTSLRNRGFEAYLPLYRSRRRWSDRYVEVESPLFPGYVFCRFDPHHALPILKIPGIVSIVGNAGQPSPIPDCEIAAIQTVLRSGRDAEPWPFLHVGEKVRLRSGSLDGLEGILVRKKSQWRIVVSVTLLQRSVAVEVDRECVTPAR